MAYYTYFCNLFILLIQFCVFGNVVASPYGYQQIARKSVDVSLEDFTQWDHKPLLPRAGQWLRIMPLGASITYGQRGDGKTTNDVSHNGYRKPLRDQLRSRGYNVNMIGCVSSGQMRDKQHEGHPGFLISEVASKVSCAIDQKPNLVLINAGTNDALRADQNGGISFAQGAKDRMQTMIDDILTQVDGVTVILSTLLPNGNAAANNYVSTINTGYRNLVSSYQSAGKPVQLADMNTGWISASELPDGTHPTDAGYGKMAAVWDQAFVAATNKGWIKNPSDTGKPDDVYDCDTSPASFSQATMTQRGSGADDGTYAYASQAMGVLTSDSLHESSSSATKGQWIKNYHFAQLVNGGGDRGQETDELIRITDPLQPVADTGIPLFSYKQNNGGNFASSWTSFDPKMRCNNRGAHWGDVNNDGLDDLICIGPVRTSLYAPDSKSVANDINTGRHHVRIY
jgi:lysophospholipase L1-like esterase